MIIILNLKKAKKLYKNNDNYYLTNLEWIHSREIQPNVLLPGV
jgi:hypothetical protein